VRDISVRARNLPFVALPLVLADGMLGHPDRGLAQETESALARRVKHRENPVYPELARRLSIEGKVKLEVTVGANGKVKSTKVVGGHPLLISASEDAIRKWAFELAAGDATAVIEFEFHPQ
jgi:TonB family protein